MKLLILTIAFFSSLTALATPYSLEDYNVDAYLVRTVDDPDFKMGRINGFGLDYPFQVRTGSNDVVQYSNTFKLDVDKDRFTINFLYKSSWQDGIVFRLEQPDYATTTGADFWCDLLTDTNIAGLTTKIGSGWVELNLSQTRFDNNSYFIGYLNYKEVPEPASYLLLLVGLFGIYFKTHRRRSN